MPTPSKPILALLLLCSAILLASACSRKPAEKNLFRQDNLLAWCIVPYDSLERSPAERVDMLKRLNFSQYAWDWRQKHLAALPAEIKLAQAKHIRIAAAWLWIDDALDTPTSLSPGNQAVIDAFANANLPTEYWVGFHENVFANLDQDQRVAKGTAIISHLHSQIAPSGSTLSLYNHGGWFGQAENQIAIIEATELNDIGLVYNFHHAHHEIAELEDKLELMLPYLTAVNLNGMIPDGPKILRLGQGTHEKEMLKILQESGYTGPIGILGHDDTADVEKVLAENLQALRQLTTDL